MKIFLRALFTVWAYVNFILLMLIAFAYNVIVATFGGRNRIELMYKSLQPWARAWAYLNGVEIEVKGQERFRKDQSYIFVSNHGSVGDIIIVAAAMSNRYRPLGKMEVTKIPFMGFMFKRMLVTVDRSDAESRKQCMEKMRELVKQNISVLILPEGTRNRTTQPLQPFKEGAFRLAIEFQLPIVPMVLLNTRKLYPNNSILMNPSGLKCHFLEPVPTAGMTEEDIPALTQKVFNLIEKHVIENEDEFEALRKA